MIIGEKRFQCPECLKRFMRSDHLSKHLKTHQAKKAGLIPGGPTDLDTASTGTAVDTPGEITAIDEQELAIAEAGEDDSAELVTGQI